MNLGKKYVKNASKTVEKKLAFPMKESRMKEWN